jgi:hypothetical protein
MINIMGTEAIGLLNIKLSSIGRRRLRNLLDDIPKFDQESYKFLKEYFLNLGITAKQNPVDINYFINCLICFNALGSMARAQKDFTQLYSESVKEYIQGAMSNQEIAGSGSQVEFLRSICSIFVREILPDH